MSSQARQILTLEASRKRKEPEGSSGFKAPPLRKKPEPLKPKPKPTALAPAQPAALPARNRLLAGYLAHEFLTKGTLFGEQFDPARAEQKDHDRAEPENSKPAAYADVAYLLKFDGTHIRDVVNPTQLGRWIQKGGYTPLDGQQTAAGTRGRV